MHYSVLLDESIELLDIKPEGIYVDGTFGRGGHTKVILDKLGKTGRLIAFDKDIEAISYAKQNIHDGRLILIHDSIANLKRYLQSHNIDAIDGLLLDLGVSSPQLDNESRGFSFRFDSELDMRMDNTQGVNCREWINSVTEAELNDVLWRYGEERFSRKIAKNIVASREKKPIVTTKDLTQIIENSIPFKFREKGQNPATRSFQALRIVINNELEDIENIIKDAPDLLKIGGRIVVISFHSLEDRIIKTKFNELSKPKDLPKWVMVEESSTNFRVVAKKIKAKLDEIEQNVRSRSAVMRCLERIK